MLPSQTRFHHHTIQGAEASICKTEVWVPRHLLYQRYTKLSGVAKACITRWVNNDPILWDSPRGSGIVGRSVVRNPGVPSCPYLRMSMSVCILPQRLIQFSLSCPTNFIFSWKCIQYNVVSELRKGVDLLNSMQMCILQGKLNCPQSLLEMVVLPWPWIPNHITNRQEK